MQKLPQTPLLPDPKRVPDKAVYSWAKDLNFILTRSQKKMNRVVNKLVSRLSGNAATDDSDLGNKEIDFWIDESNNKLEIKVKYSDGTIKTGNINLS